MPEAPPEQSDSWFVVNVRDTEWVTSAEFGSGCMFETPDSPFREMGMNISVLLPGEPNCLYHSESQQEAFLVLSGECRLLVDGVERPMQAWDFFHCPAGTEHVFVGAGDGPCAILMAGVRRDDEKLLYPRSELAAKYGASAERETPSPKEAYAAYQEPQPGRPPYWDELPWAGG